MPPSREGDPPAALEGGRITTSLTPRTDRELTAMRTSTGHSKTDLINRAISLYAFVTGQLDAGMELYVRNPGTGESQRIQLL